MKKPRLKLVAILVVVLSGFGPRVGSAQDPVKKDDALEKLLEKLDEPKPAPPDPKPPAKPDAKPANPGKKDDALEKLLDKLDGAKPSADASKGTPASKGEVGSKDQSLDKLLEGLGGANDKPSPDDKKQSGGSGASDEPPPPQGGGSGDGAAKPDPLDNASKQLDDLLEEKTGRKPQKSKKQNQGQGRGQGQGGEGEDDAGTGGGGPLDDLIKRMRDVENRLGQPDTGAETRQKQTEIVKNLDTLIEQVRNSTSQGQALKMIRQGQKPGDQPQPGKGNQPGATAQGTGPTKPTPPRIPPAPVELAKEVWGQLPAQFRDDMANVLNEKALPTKEDMIRLYYLSLGKKSASKEN